MARFAGSAAGDGADRPPYANRGEAGDVLAESLRAYAGRDDVVVLGLPRGGLPVAARVAARLGAPLDVLVVRKLGLPMQPELAMGAIASVGGEVVVVRNDYVLARAARSREQFEQVLAVETEQLRRREAAYRAGRDRPAITGRVVIVVDDGLATGSTMRAAVAALRQVRPAMIVVAVPIGSLPGCAELAREADVLVCPWRPARFGAVGQGYRDFRATDDAEVERLLRASREQ